MTQIQTRFILTLYRLGKDAIADNYSIQSSQLDVVYCAKIGVKIASVRLHLSIESLKKSRKHRHLISHLDADVLDWVSETANESMMLFEHLEFFLLFYPSQ